MKFHFAHRGQIHEIDLQKNDQGYVVSSDEERFLVQAGERNDGGVKFLIDGVEIFAYVLRDGGQLWLQVDGRSYLLERRAGAAKAAAKGSAERIMLAPMPGQVKDVLASKGQRVEAGQTLLVLEAMKMELRIEAPFSGGIVDFIIEKGASVEKEQVLVEMKAEDKEA